MNKIGLEDDEKEIKNFSVSTYLAAIIVLVAGA